MLLLYADPAQPLTAAGEELDDLGHDLSVGLHDSIVVWNINNFVEAGPSHETPRVSVGRHPRLKIVHVFPKKKTSLGMNQYTPNIRHSRKKTSLLRCSPRLLPV